MNPSIVQSRVDAAVGRMGVEDATGALVGEVVGHIVREEIEGEGLEETMRMRRR